MRGPIALVILLLLGGGCSRPAPPTPSGVDTSEILIRHLLRRIAALNDEISQGENKCLEEQNALLRGQRVKHRSDPLTGLNRLSQYLLDGEAATEQHNRNHPEAPWAESKDLLRDMCGDCTREKAIRAAPLEEEAKADAPKK
jgi:hypothetical protein